MDFKGTQFPLVDLPNSLAQAMPPDPLCCEATLS